MNIFSVYKIKSFEDFIIFLKFKENHFFWRQIFENLNTPKPSLGHVSSPQKIFWLDWFYLKFIGYKQTDKQSIYINIVV